MSVRFEAANSESASVAGLLAASGDPITLGGWVYINSFPASTSTAAPVVEMYGSFNGWAAVLAHDGSNWVFGLYDHNAAGSDLGTTVLSTGTWYYLWITATAGTPTDVNLYLDESTSAEATVSGFLATQPDLSFADDTSGFLGAHADVRLLNWKAWSAVNAASNAASESPQPEHQTDTGNALSEWILDDHTTDLVDNGPGTNDLTASGTLSTEANTGSWSAGGGGGLSIPVAMNYYSRLRSA